MNQLESMEYKNTFDVVLNKTLSNSSLILPSNFSDLNPSTQLLSDSMVLPPQIPSTATVENSGKPFIFSYFVDDLVWWLFWVGIYVDPKDSSAFASHY